MKQSKSNASDISLNLGMAWGFGGYLMGSKLDCFHLMAAAPWECCGVLVGFLWGFCRCVVGVLWGSQVLGGNLEGFLWDDHGAFPTPEGPLQKVPLSPPNAISYHYQLDHIPRAIRMAN